MLAVIEKIRWIFEFMKNGDQQIAMLHFGLNEKIFMCVCVCVRIYITCNEGILLFVHHEFCIVF